MKLPFSLAMVMALCGSASIMHAAEQPYPQRPVRVLVGLAPGGGTDTYARIISQKLTDTLGQQFIVDNRPSAGGNVAGELAARRRSSAYFSRMNTKSGRGS